VNRRPTLDPLDRLVGAGLAAGRIAIGVGIWTAPTLAAKGLGLNRFEGQGLALARLAATRDVLLGVWLLSELRDEGNPVVPAAALTACDAGDALTFALLARSDSESAKAGLHGVATAGPATLAGAWLTRRLSR
jgi:hypothetical protein